LGPEGRLRGDVRACQPAGVGGDPVERPAWLSRRGAGVVKSEAATLPAETDIEAILRGRHGNPFSVLGMHGGGDRPLIVNVFAPEAASVTVLDAASDKPAATLDRIDPEGFFSGEIEGRAER